MFGKGKKVYALGLSTNDKLEDAEFNVRFASIVDRCELFSEQTLASVGIDENKIARRWNPSFPIRVWRARATPSLSSRFSMREGGTAHTSRDC